MSLNPNIHVATYFRITLPFYETIGGAPQAAINKWGPLHKPSDDPEVEGELITQANSSMQEVIEAALRKGIRDVDTPFTFEHIDGQKPDRESENPTHVMIGMRNVGGAMHAEAIQIAQAQSKPYSEVVLAWDEALEYLNTGTLPE